ncbi:hypothetical protein BDF22DRAFT_743126 [Syncephalis plumigaleata]|nr:hypothetical protein BDF22DRAFT_743126 [Syncephalis plumigaleata]
MSTQHQTTTATASPPTATSAVVEVTRQQSDNRFSKSQLEPIPFSDESDSEPEAFDPVREPDHDNEDNEDAALYYESDEQLELDDAEMTKSQLTEVTREQTIHAGYLMKRGELRKTWKKRWFVLRQSELVYYKDQKEYKLLSIIPLDSILACAEVQRTKKRKSKRANVFGIVTTKRKFYFSAPSPEDMLTWLRLIRDTRANLMASRNVPADEASLHTGPLKHYNSPNSNAHDKTVARQSTSVTTSNAQPNALEINATSVANGRTVTFVVQKEVANRSGSSLSQGVAEPTKEAIAGPSTNTAIPQAGTSSAHETKKKSPKAGSGQESDEQQSGKNRVVDQTSFDDYADDEFDLKSDDEEAAAIILADAEEVDDMDDDGEDGEVVSYITRRPRKIWKKRWFVLRPTQLVYYKDQREYKSLGIIDLIHIKAVAAIPRKKRMNVFGVLTIRRKYYFQAGSPEDMLGWIHALREACQAATDNAQETTEKPAAHRRSLLPSWATPTRPSVDSTNTTNNNNHQGAVKSYSNPPVSNQSATSINTTAVTAHMDDTTSPIPAGSSGSNGSGGSTEPVLLQGYLTKLSHNSKVGAIRTWQKRWFVLRNSQLTYYKNDKESTPRQSIPLSHMQTIQVISDSPSKQRPFCLQLVTHERPYLLSADTSTIRDRWYQAINTTIQSSRAEPTTC